MRTCNAESQNGQQKVPILKQTTGLCPSRSYYSMIVIVAGIEPMTAATNEPHPTTSLYSGRQRKCRVYLYL